MLRRVASALNRRLEIRFVHPSGGWVRHLPNRPEAPDLACRRVPPQSR